MVAARCQFQFAPGGHGQPIDAAHARNAVFQFRTVNLHVSGHTG